VLQTCRYFYGTEHVDGNCLSQIERILPGKTRIGVSGKSVITCIKIYSIHMITNFQVVDMRWGVRDEATDDHMTTELCMKEIDNCQRLSMGPNFVVFLGQKYGYRPIPTYILASELAQFREILLTMGQEVVLLDTWY